MGNANECLWEDLLHQQAARHKSMGAAFVGSKEGSNYSFSAILKARDVILMRNCEMKAGGKKKFVHISSLIRQLAFIHISANALHRHKHGDEYDEIARLVLSMGCSASRR